MWCDIELLKRAIVLRFLPLFFCYTLRTAAKYVPKPYILCLSSLRLASFLRVTSPTTHLRGWVVFLFFFFFPFASSKHAKIIYIAHCSAYAPKAEFSQRNIRCAAGDIRIWGLRNVFLFLFQFPHTKHTPTHYAQKTHAPGKKKTTRNAPGELRTVLQILPATTLNTVGFFFSFLGSARFTGFWGLIVGQIV